MQNKRNLKLPPMVPVTVELLTEIQIYCQVLNSLSANRVTAEVSSGFQEADTQ